MILMTHTTTYINQYIIPAVCAIVIAGVSFRLHDKLLKLQMDEDLSVSKIIHVSKKYILIIILSTVVGTGSLIQTLDSYFK